MSHDNTTTIEFRHGMKVRTAATLATWSGMGAGGVNARWRRPNAVGTVEGHPSPWPDGCWLVWHDGAEQPALYRESELTPETETETEPQAPPNVAAIERLFQAIVERRNALEETLVRLVAALPEEVPWSMLRAQAQVEKTMAGKVADVEAWRAMVAEIQRPKGPMIRVETRRPGTPWFVLRSYELLRRTSTTIFLRDNCGDRYSLTDGTRLSPGSDMRIHPDDLVVAQTTDWAPPKPSKPANKKH
jgi:hypothetical protein